MEKLQSTNLLFEISKSGRRCHTLPPSGVPAAKLDSRFQRVAPPPLPEVAELDLVRHFTNLSSRNMAIDCNFYPLGSCTMKYNPKRHERLVALPGFAGLHPLQPDCTIQGMLAILYEAQLFLTEIAGLHACSLQPAAGAQGELTALLVAAAYFKHKGENRTRVLVPDSAHGTNPASAAIAGFDSVTIKSGEDGLVELADLESKLDERTAVFMITNPNTLGLFDNQILEITRKVHEKGALVYLDGDNMNAILGITRPGDFGADMMHYNPHKTFSGPHGGGGPGAGPIAVRAMLEPFLPTPRVVRHEGGFSLDFNHPKSIGRVRSFFGNVGVLLRAYAYIRTLGADGLADVSRYAVLNANYLLALLRDLLPVPYSKGCLHEFVGSAMEMKSRSGISAMDLAKRLLDYGFHAPTVYFPITVREAVMIEPTETESRETLDAFADAIRTIIGEPTELVQAAPHTAAVNRPDEVQAAKSQRLAWSAAP